MACFNIFNVFDIILQRACSMKHESSTSLTYPGSCKNCFFQIPVFVGKSFLIVPIIYQTVDLKLICIIGQSDLVNPLISANSCPGWHIYSLWGFFSIFTVCWSQLALKFYWDKTCAFLMSFDITNYIEITWSVMPKPVFLMTVQEAHKEYNSLTDQIWARYEQLDSGEYGVVGIPRF